MEFIQDGVKVFCLPDEAHCEQDEEKRSPLDIEICPIDCIACNGDCIHYSEHKRESMIKVYKMNDYSNVASDLSLEETNAWYEKEFGEDNDIEDVEELDLDKDGMWFTLTDESKIQEFLNECIEETMTETKFGSLMTRDYNEVYEFISYREALKRIGEYTEPYEIASTEF